MRRTKFTFSIIIFMSAILLVPAAYDQKAFADTVGFQGDFAPENWTLEQNGENGFVVTDNAPDSIELHGANYPEEEVPQCDFNLTEFWIIIPEDGIISFDWVYTTDDFPFFDRAGFSVNDDVFILADADNTSGNVLEVNVNAGDRFSFGVESDDCLFGEGIFMPISNFLLESAEPEPEPGLAHSYLFDGNFEDELGGPDLTNPFGGLPEGTLGSYIFDDGEGLGLFSAEVSPDNYSVEMCLKVGDGLDNEFPGWRKLIDFDNFGSDNGLYLQPGDTLRFFAGIPIFDGDTPITNDEFFHLVLTRDGISDNVRVYLDGEQEFGFTDEDDLAVFPSPDNVLQFINDDDDTENPDGTVDYINIYQGALSSDEVFPLASQCEPEELEEFMYGSATRNSATPGIIVTIDRNTGAQTPVGDPVPGTDGIGGLAFDSNGRLFGSTIAGQSLPSELIEINPNDGSLIQSFGTIIDDAGEAPLKINDLAIQPGTDVIYGVTSASSPGGGSEAEGRLYTIDISGGSPIATRVGLLDLGNDEMPIAFAPDGTLYMTCYNCVGDPGGRSQLLTINPDTGVILTRASLDDLLINVALGISNDGTIFGHFGPTHPFPGLTSISTSGVVTEIGIGEERIHDLAFSGRIAQGPDPITEVHCDFENETEIDTFEDGLSFSVDGSCDVHRGDSVESKDVSLDVLKDIPGLEIPEGSDVDLFDWTEESFGGANWSVSEGGSTVFQSQNGDPTYFYAPFNSFNTQFTGKISVANDGDNDFVGFVLGFQPGDTGNVDADYLLVDWKQGDQTAFGGNFGAEGLAVSRVTGVPDGGEFWGHNDSEGGNDGKLVELARGINLGDIGWVDNTEYEFEFVFTENNLKVFVDGVLEIDIDGVFNDGRIGFYNFSQSQVTYSGFNVTPVFDETGTFIINFLDESGSIGISEVGTIIVDPEGPTFTIDGTSTSNEGSGQYTNLPQCGELSFVAVQDEGDFAFGSIWLVPCPDAIVIESKKGNGGDNQWDTRPTFGVSHEDRETQVVETGFRFNNDEHMLTDNHHTNFAEKEVEIGIANSFSATVYADKGLMVQEFLFGIPVVGEGHLAELVVEVWYDRDGEIDEVKVVQKSDVIDADTVNVSHEMTKCLSTDSDARCHTTTVSMTFLEPLKDKVMAIGAIDWDRRSQRTNLNEGFDISGDSLNPMLSNMIPSNMKNQGLLKVTQMAKYSPYWTSDDGRMYEMNSFGSFKQINQSFERFEDTGNVWTRQHSGFGGIIAYEQNRALDIFDSSNLVSELPESFAYIFPESGERLTDEMIQQMHLQEEIAKAILDEMDRQDRHY